MRSLLLALAGCSALVQVDGGGATGALDADTFESRFVDKYCQALADCSPALACADPSPGGGGADCTFDSAAAETCLAATWPCSDEGVLTLDPSCALVFTSCGPIETGTATTGSGGT